VITLPSASLRRRIVVSEPLKRVKLF